MRVMQVTATLFLGLGILTPAAGVLAAAIYASYQVPHFDPNVFPYVTMPLALAMLGPGAWSVDARLYGRRRITL